LSKSSLKKANTVLDLKEDKVTMFDNPVELEFTSSGHYCINILKTNPEDLLNNRGISAFTISVSILQEVFPIYAGIFARLKEFTTFPSPNLKACELDTIDEQC
jgi:hypothetical protein